MFSTHNVIVRHMRFRRGETWMGDCDDSVGGNPTVNIMIDHVSASRGLHECMSMYRHMYQPPEGGQALKLPTVNVTIQNSDLPRGAQNLQSRIWQHHWRREQHL